MSKKGMLVRRYVGIAIAVGLLAAWVSLLYVASPQEIVSSIGIKNTYLVAFVLAVCAGVSTLTSTSFYATIATFAAGGSSPFVLGLAGGVGAFLSNIIFYTLFHYGKHVLTGRAKDWMDAFARWIERFPPWMICVGIFLYSGFTPFPDDILMAGIALSSYSFVRIAPYLLAGNITLITSIALLAQSGVSFL